MCTATRESLRIVTFSSVQLVSHVQHLATTRTAACQASLSITNSQSLPKLMSIMWVMPYNYLILCCPLLPPSIFLSIGVFSNESINCIRWPKYWSFSFSITFLYSKFLVASLCFLWIIFLLPKEPHLLTSFSSVQFSVVSNSLRPHGLQHARPPCTSPAPRVYSNSCPLSW